jgi:hypothetical protein
MRWHNREVGSIDCLGSTYGAFTFIVLQTDKLVLLMSPGEVRFSVHCKQCIGSNGYEKLSPVALCHVSERSVR